MLSLFLQEFSGQGALWVAEEDPTVRLQTIPHVQGSRSVVDSKDSKVATVDLSSLFISVYPV